jgi:antibiotic biosynthesis monooxygenase (ABM) superfamily enzyme
MDRRIWVHTHSGRNRNERGYRRTREGLDYWYTTTLRIGDWLRHEQHLEVMIVAFSVGWPYTFAFLALQNIIALSFLSLISIVLPFCYYYNASGVVMIVHFQQRFLLYNQLIRST